MLKPKKSIARREVEQDDMIASFNRARSFYDVNRKYIGYAVTAVVVLIVAGFLYFNNRAKNNVQAATELGKVFSLYDGGQYKAAIDGQPERGIKGLKWIVDQYGSTDNGQLARFYLADAYYNTGAIDEAEKEFDKFSGGDNVLKASAAAGLAACYESKGKYADAGSAFEKAANIVASDAASPDYLASAGRNYMKAKEKEKALSVYERLKKDYPTSQAARDAERYIAQISA